MQFRGGNGIEEQSGRPIQHQIPQSQRGKAKTVLVDNNQGTASFLSDLSFNKVRKRRTCHVIFPWFTGSYIHIRSFCNIQNEMY